MKFIKKAGSTSNIFQIFIADSSSIIGAGLTALTSGSGGLTAYYHRDTDTTATVINLTSLTLGTFTSSGFLKIDDTNMPGCYQFCPPDAAMASGAKSVMFMLKGATNMAPLPIEVQLVAYDPDNATTLGLTNLDDTVSSRLASASYTAPDNSTIAAIAGYVDTEVALIKAKTDLIPAVPASQGDVTTVGTAVAAVSTKLGTPVLATVSLDIAAVPGKSAVATIPFLP